MDKKSYLYAIEGVNGHLTVEIASEMIAPGEGSPWSLFHQGQQPRSVIPMTHLWQLSLTLLHKIDMVMRHQLRVLAKSSISVEGIDNRLSR